MMVGLFKKRIKFSKCIFEGDTDFESARIGGNTEFIGAEFKKGVSFIQVQIEGAAFLTQLLLWVRQTLHTLESVVLPCSLKPSLRAM
jgi:hypothetical protein